MIAKKTLNLLIKVYAYANDTPYSLRSVGSVLSDG